MPKSKQHQEKAEHNRFFLATIADDRYADWKARVAFYTADVCLRLSLNPGNSLR